MSIFRKLIDMFRPRVVAEDKFQREWRMRLELMEQQDRWTDEGGRACVAGEPLTNCPFWEHTAGYTFWTHGWYIARGERQTIEAGHIDYCSTSSPTPLYSLPLDEAVRTGTWRPKYAKLPPHLVKLLPICSTSPVMTTLVCSTDLPPMTTIPKSSQ